MVGQEASHKQMKKVVLRVLYEFGEGTLIEAATTVAWSGSMSNRAE